MCRKEDKERERKKEQVCVDGLRFGDNEKIKNIE